MLWQLSNKLAYVKHLELCLDIERVQLGYLLICRLKMTMMTMMMVEKEQKEEKMTMTRSPCNGDTDFFSSGWSFHCCNTIQLVNCPSEMPHALAEVLNTQGGSSPSQSQPHLCTSYTSGAALAMSAHDARQYFYAKCMLGPLQKPEM